jgi:hypothetical protein
MRQEERLCTQKQFADGITGEVPTINEKMGYILDNTFQKPQHEVPIYFRGAVSGN